MSIKKGTMPPRYDDAFKSGAIKMVTEQGRPSKEVAAELGICVETLKSWLKRAGFQPGATDRQNRIDKRQRELKAEIRSLRKQLAEKDEVIDVLKKSVGIFSKLERTSIVSLKLITILCDHNQHSIGFRRLSMNTYLAFMPRKLLDNE